MSERLIDANTASILVIHAAGKHRSVAHRLVIIKSSPCVAGQPYRNAIPANFLNGLRHCLKGCVRGFRTNFSVRGGDKRRPAERAVRVMNVRI